MTPQMQEKVEVLKRQLRECLEGVKARGEFSLTNVEREIATFILAKVAQLYVETEDLRECLRKTSLKLEQIERIVAQRSNDPNLFV